MVFGNLNKMKLLRNILILLEIVFFGIGFLSLVPIDRHRTAQAYAAVSSDPSEHNKQILRDIQGMDEIANHTIRATLFLILLANTYAIYWVVRLGKKSR